MLTRIKQVISAITAKISAADRAFIAANLNKGEQQLFFAMNLPDQRHALNVAYTAMRLAEELRGVNNGLLVKSALLHDVGKVRGDVSTLDKIITVLAYKLAPRWAENWGVYGRGTILDNLRHAFYIYFHHPERGAKLLSGAGVEPEIVGIIRRHHRPPEENEPPELSLLRRADNLH